jgi:hypothetical protein
VYRVAHSGGHRQRAASQRRDIARQSRLSVVDQYLESAQLVLPVARTRGRDGIRHQRHPLRARGRDQPAEECVVDVESVGNDLQGDPGIFQERQNRARLALVERPHGIEQVRRHGGARCDRRLRLGVGGVGVANCGDGAMRRDGVDRLQAAR